MRISKLSWAALFFLAACGGGGGDDGGGSAAGPVAEGGYVGTFAGGMGDSVQLIILDGGEYWALYGTTFNNVLYVEGFIQGTGTSKDGVFTSANGKDFGYEPALTVTASATYVAGTSIEGSLRVDGQPIAFSATPPSTSIFDYSLPASLTAISGNWNLTELDGTNTSITISSTGSAAGISDGCSISGTFTPRPSGKNVFNVTARFGPTPCELSNQTVTGIGVVTTPAGTTSQQLVIGLLDANRSIGYVAFGSRGGVGGGNNEPPPAGVTKTPLAIDATNYQAVATESVSSVAYVLDTTGLFTGAAVSSDRVLIDFARAQLTKLPRWFATATPRLTGAEITEVEPCSGGGDVRVTLNDINNNQELDAGESITMVARNCVEFDATVNGTLGIRVTSLSGDPYSDVYQLGATTTLTNLAVTMPGGNAVGNGTIVMDLSGTGPGTGRTALTFDALTMTGRYGGVDYARSMWEFRIVATFDVVSNVFRDSVEVNGVLVSSALQSKAVTLSTLAPLVSVGADEYPSSGRVLATGASGSKMRLTAQNATTVLIELDANGDGSYETMVTRPWSDLM